MIPTKTPRLFGAITAALAGAALLAGCAGGTTASPEPADPTTPVAAVEPDIYKARVIDVLSGDTLRVQMKTAVYRDGVSGSGEREEVEVPSETIVVKDPTFDAPTPGECGFEESRSYFVTGVLGQKGPEWVLDEDRKVTIELSRDSIEDLPEADGEVQFYQMNYRNHPAATMLHRGYAQVGELMRVDTDGKPLHPGLAGWEKRARVHANESGNLWATCWAE